MTVQSFPVADSMLGADGKAVAAMESGMDFGQRISLQRDLTRLFVTLQRFS